MSNEVKIKVSGVADMSAVEKEVNGLGQSIAQANRMQFSPVSVKGLSDLKEAERRTKELIKLSSSLKAKLNATGQQNKPFHEWDWERMHPHAASRGGAMLNAYRRVYGDAFSPLAPTPNGNPPNTPGGRPPVPPAPPTPPRPARPGDGSWRGVAGQVAQAGLRGAGPIGNVGANAVGAGMSGGMAMGAMGLVGGILALGVGKLVSAATEKLGEAETNNVDIDTLKRNLGDVGVQFGVLKTAVHGSADQFKITYHEAGRLASQFAKTANLSASHYKTIGQEVGTGVGLSRSFGLDPSEGVGVLAQMRNLGITRDAQESRRFALLIGETIGKSDAFAKAGEVMEAMASYATSQTRSGMGHANVAGYAGMLSGMVGSGLPGMDVAGSASMLSRINASLAGGGAKGEASQFFTTSLGARMGMSPYQMRSMREHGAFATADQAFGKGSVWSRYNGGRVGPSGSTTLLQGTLEGLRSQYGAGSDELADATANHLGIGYNQAMALHLVKPNQMGEMQNYAKDLTKLSGTGIGNLSKALYGSAGDRSALADEYLGRTGADAISTKDAEAIRGAQGDDGRLRDVLGKIAAGYDQERTQGSDIRDSKNLLENLKTAIADKLVPLTQDIRAGVLHLAGKGDKTGDQVLRDIAEMETKDRSRRVSNIANDARKRIEEDYEERATAIAPGVSPGDIFKQKWHQEAGKKIKDGTITPEERVAFNERVKKYEAARLAGMEDPEVGRKKRELHEEKQRMLKAVNDKEKVDLEAENKRLRDKLKEIETSPLGLQQETAVPGRVAGEAGRITSAGGSSGGRFDPLNNTSGGGAGPTGKTEEAMKYFMDKGWTRQQAAGIVANLHHESNLRAGAVGDGGKAYGVAQWHPDRQANFERWAGKSIRGSSLDEQYGFVHHELTDGAERQAGRLLKNTTTARDAGSVVSQYYERPKYRYAEAYKRAASADRFASEGTRMPAESQAGAGAGRGSVNPAYNISASPMDLRITFDSTGKPVPPEPIAVGLKVNTGRPSPFGVSGPSY